MRIVAGTYGGRKLIVPQGRDIRPTSDKIRGAVMNMLRSRGAIDGAHVMDVFCGTGALGLEAISQGASSCVFIDQSRESLELAKENAKALGVSAEFMLKDVTKLGLKPESKPQASLIFIDPPYKKDLVLPALEMLHYGGWIAPSAWIVVEAEEKFSAVWPVFVLLESEKIYGETKIVLLKIQ
jgi:16S rRNA (guanine966-N2)-methyltransferase